MLQILYVVFSVLFDTSSCYAVVGKTHFFLQPHNNMNNKKAIKSYPTLPTEKRKYVSDKAIKEHKFVAVARSLIKLV
jgi:hypothetical protein